MSTLLLALALAAGPVVAPCPAGVEVLRSGPALSAALASGRRELWLSGTLEGDFSAEHGVRLHGCEGAVLRGSGSGTVLRIHGDDTLVENLVIERSGARVSAEDGALKLRGERAHVQHVAVRDALYGIALEQCHHCSVEDTHVVGRSDVPENQRGDGIKLWEAHGSSVRRSRVSGVRDVVVWYSRDVTLEDNLVEHGRYGTHFMYAHGASVRRSVLRHNTVGIFVMYTERVTVEDCELSGARGAAGMGVGFKESDAVVLRRNTLVANSVGSYLDYTPRDPHKPVLFEHNAFALNGVALRTHASERGARFKHNDFRDNDQLVEVDGNGDALGVTFSGNYWDSYAGYDLDRSGVGDVAFQVKEPRASLGGAHPALRYFRGTPAMTLYEAVASALPFFGTRLVLEDAAPAMHPHRELPR